MNPVNPRPLIVVINACLQARANCARSGNNEWLTRHTARLDYIARELLPSGNGIDSGTGIDVDRSGDQRIAFTTSFHHMDEHGGYDGWTEHTVVARPSFDGFVVTVTGRNRNDIKDYLADLFHHVLSQLVTESADAVTFVPDATS